MMSASKPQLYRIDLSINTRSTLAALVRLLAPHVPYSLHILGAIFNTRPRTGTLHDIDSSKVSLWSTIPLHADTVISATDVHALFSFIAFSHPNHQFYFFCSAEPQGGDSSPTEVEETHVKQVFQRLLDIAGEAHPKYTSILTPSPTEFTHRIDTDPPQILVSAVHAKWSTVLEPEPGLRFPSVRYVFPPGILTGDAGFGTATHMSEMGTVEVEVSEIRASDVPFVYAASTVQRTDAYILSRAPYSVCLRERVGVDRDGSRLLACALMHYDGSIGAVRVDPEYRRRGLGKRVIRALVEKLDSSRGLVGKSELVSDDHLDLGGGALGWNWMDTEASNEGGNQFFTSLVGRDNIWKTDWIYMPIHPS